MVAAQTWQDVATQAQHKLAESIPSEWRISPEKLPPSSRLDVTGYPAESGLLSAEELDITGQSATIIVDKLARGEWSSVQVTTAFCKRAAIAHQLTNCLTVIMFKDALERARQLDEHLQQTGKPLGPLHGLPVSLKDGFNVSGYPSSVGFTAWALEPMQTESSIVTTLKALGAVPYVKTNVPTAMMIAESVNNVYGRTVNPLNRELTSGGSSGGESALIAMGGSCLGVGTDIGGSLRIPAACTGIFTLKPSLGRFPHFDARSGLAGQESIASVQGPMARSSADLQLWSASIVGSQPWQLDPKALPIPWRQITLPRKLKIGILWDNGDVHPTPPVARALATVVDRLRAAGHDLIDWPPLNDHREAFDLVRAFFSSDGGQSISSLLATTAEPWRPEMQSYATAKSMPVYNLWQLHAARTALQKRYLDRVAAAGLDAILGPTTPYVAPKHGGCRCISYTCIFNLLDYASVSFPTGLVADRERDRVDDGVATHTELDEQTQREYDADAVHGLPISLQLTAGRLEEEKVLAMTERVLADIGAI